MVRHSFLTHNRVRRRAHRTLRVEPLEIRHMLDGASLVGDAYTVNQNGPQIELEVLANDLFDHQYQGPRLITSVSYGSEGGRLAIAADGQSIRYTPPADFFGIEAFVYSVDAQFTAQVQVTVRSALGADRYSIPPDGLERTLDVLANDPFWADYDGPRNITSVSVASAGGMVTIGTDGRSISYTPPEEAFGTETFIYIVDDIYPAQVTIEIPETLKNDRYETIQHGPAQTLDVLANDPFWPGYAGTRQITHILDAPGLAAISDDGRSIVFTPGDVSGWHSFRYIVDGSYEATVSVQIHRPVQDDWFEVDENSAAFYYNVTINDFYYDLSSHPRDVIDRVTAVTQSAHGGTVAIASDGRGVLYTPADGFSGTDTFTYTADGVHEATVYVQVTRPVRDDYIDSAAIQDTPNGTLDVLANDFLGDGYDGPRQITSVGPTENGGTLTIRADAKAIFYTPAPGFTGHDRFTYLVDGELEATVTVYVRPLAETDYFQFGPDPAHGAYVLNVLGNDLFLMGYAGPGAITSASVLDGDGAVSIQDGARLLFDPERAGSHTLRYVVDGKYEATVSIWIAEHLNPDQFVVDQNAPPQSFDVLANDFIPDPYYVTFRSQDYPGPRRITGVSQSQQGGVVTVAADGLSVRYEPPADFHGEDQFTYTVDGFMVEAVTIEVIRRVRDDQFRVDLADGPQSLPVLVNDLFGANYTGTGQITSVTSTSAGGSAIIGADGRSIVYTPSAGFVGTDTFTYTVDGALKAEVRVVVDSPREAQLPTFGSLAAYTQFLIDDALVRYANLFGQTAWNDYYVGGPEFDFGSPVANSGDRSHSETNVQVAGVDEGDIVEFDADYVYMLTDDEVVIVDAWPADELSIASRVEIEGRPIAEFLHGDRLTVISEVGGGYDWPIYWAEMGPVDFAIDRLWWPPVPRLPSSTIVTVIDVSDRASPTIVQTTSMEGKYVDSRGVDDFVYVLVNNPDAVASRPEVVDDDDNPSTPGRYETRDEYLARVAANTGEFVDAALPNYSSYDSAGKLVRTGLLNTPEDVCRPLVPDVTSLISVMSFDVDSNEPGLVDSSAVYSTGASAIYASRENFYVFDRDYAREDGATTRIMTFDWEPGTGGIQFAATTVVPGSILNQFSADESGDYLRIATTVSNSYSGNWSSRDENALFVLQEDDGVFEVVGSLQNLALNERMQSVRFMGDRAFISTFREIDPLFAIDLTDPARPESVGHITLPGYTSYMQLIDDNHLLTVGRNTPIGQSGPTQVALFDITELAQPRRIAEFTFERFSTSEAEIDHHAFGYYAEHALLGMPVGRVFFERVDTDGDGYRETRQTRDANDLAVFQVNASASDPDSRLRLVSEIEHATPVRRSGYIGDKLYSIANDSVKVVDVATPSVVIAELIIATGDGIEPALPASPYVEFSTTDTQREVVFPATRTDAPFVDAIDRAARDLANRLGQQAGAPLLVTAEAAPTAPGGGYWLVFRVGEAHYLYRASESGLVELVETDFEFAGAATGAWHAIAMSVPDTPSGMKGDFNRDGQVDEVDVRTWRENFGAVSLVGTLSADGNRDGMVDSADYTIWRDNMGRIAGDYNRDGLVDDGDYAFWKMSFGATSGPALEADGNGNGIVDTADYSLWRDRRTASDASASFAAQSSTIEAAFAALSAAADSAVAQDGIFGGEVALGLQIALLRAESEARSNSSVPRSMKFASHSRFSTAAFDGVSSLDLQLALPRSRSLLSESRPRFAPAAIDEAFAVSAVGDNTPGAKFSAIDEAILGEWSAEKMV